MFFRVMRAERLKLLHSPVWVPFLVMPLFPAFFGSVNFMNNQGVLSLTWESLWTQNSMLTPFARPRTTMRTCSCGLSRATP